MGEICQLIGIGPSTGFKVICSVTGSFVFCGIFTAVGFKIISCSRYSYVICSIFFLCRIFSEETLIIHICTQRCVKSVTIELVTICHPAFQ